MDKKIFLTPIAEFEEVSSKDILTVSTENDGEWDFTNSVEKLVKLEGEE